MRHFCRPCTIFNNFNQKFFFTLLKLFSFSSFCIFQFRSSGKTCWNNLRKTLSVTLFFRKTLFLLLLTLLINLMGFFLSIYGSILYFTIFYINSIALYDVQRLSLQTIYNNFLIYLQLCFGFIFCAKKG